MSKFYVYDFEVFAHDWIVVFRELQSEDHYVIHNDNQSVIDFINENDVYCGFNTKNYDKFIMWAVLQHQSPEEIKSVNDWIIGGNKGWECPTIRPMSFNNVDIMDDMQQGLILKAIEGHLRMDIVESSVPFNLDRELTREELEEVITYCKHDVDATCEIVKLRKNYLDIKLWLGERIGLPPKKALALTNARLTAAYLGAVKPNEPRSDEREYRYRENVIWEYVPMKVIDFFDQINNLKITDSVLWSSSLEFNISKTEVKIGWGGCHGVIKGKHESTENTILINDDVGSYYPHLMTICGYTSRNIPDPKAYDRVLEERMEAKKAGDKQKANALKLIVNTTYGAMLDPTNPLYDPLMGRSVCISGQIYLIELACHLDQEIPGLEIPELNTDGIMLKYDKQYDKHVHEILSEWQQRTGFDLEEDKVKKVIFKDVNNYVEILDDDSVNIKGGYLVRGLSAAGAFNVNFNATIVANAIVDYYVNNTPVEETINDCDDIFQFQLIAKASHKYDGCVQEVFNGFNEYKPVQMCNRVYASKDKNLGRLYKIKNGHNERIADLPDNCVIDNDNQLKICDIDKSYYIALAKKKINDFECNEGEKMATKANPSLTSVEDLTSKISTMNVYQKLLEARILVLGSGMKKSGKNNFLKFSYFELDDIVPVVTPIFKRLGLIPIVTFKEHEAILELHNIDNPNECITFTSPRVSFEDTPAKDSNNAIQRLGSEETYQRRYLYNLCLDLCEPDSVDNNIAAPSTQTVASAPVNREEAKAVLTDEQGNATPMQIQQIKEGCKKLIARGNKDFVDKLVIATSKFTRINKSEAEAYLIEIGEQLNA